MFYFVIEKHTSYKYRQLECSKVAEIKYDKLKEEFLTTNIRL